MNLNIMLRVKFRAFFIDLAKFTKLVKVHGLPTAPGFGYTVEDYNEENAPASAKKVIDRNGVILKVWL